MLYRKSKHVFDFFLENSAIFGIIWENTVETERPQVTIRHGTVSMQEYKNRIDFVLQQWLRERTSVLCYKCISCLVHACSPLA